MTICPFMSRAIPLPANHPDKWWVFAKVECLGWECEAWKAVGGTIGAPEYGCRCIGGEVPE